MANNKIGLSYYPADTDRFQDMRIKRLKKDMGCQGFAVYEYILNEVYRVRGCFLEWDESTAFDVAEYWGLKESVVSEIVRYCGAVGLFDKELLSGGIITSHSIQSRYLEMCARAKRKNAKIPEVCRIIREECPKTTEVCRKTTEVCRKVKKSKVKKIIPPYSPPQGGQAEVPVRVDDFFKTLLAEKGNVEALLMSMGISRETFDSLCREIRQEWNFTYPDGVMAGSECRRKFLNHLRAKIKNFSQNQGAPENTPDGRQRRRRELMQWATDKLNDSIQKDKEDHADPYFIPFGEQSAV